MEIVPEREDFSYSASLSNAETDNELASRTNPTMPTSPSDSQKTFEACKKDHDSEKFRQSLKYHDKESYVTQRDHKIGIGLFNTDEIEDLPPRHKKKVLTAYEKLHKFAMELEEKSKAYNVPPPPGFLNCNTDRDDACFMPKSAECVSNSSIQNEPKPIPKYADDSYKNTHQKNSQTISKTQISKPNESCRKRCDSVNSSISVDDKPFVHPKHKCLLKDFDADSNIHKSNTSENQKEHKKDFVVSEKSFFNKAKSQQNHHNSAYKPSTQYDIQNKNSKDHKNSYTNSKLECGKDVRNEGKNISKSSSFKADHYKTQNNDLKYFVKETNQNAIPRTKVSPAFKNNVHSSKSHLEQIHYDKDHHPYNDKCYENQKDNRRDFVSSESSLSSKIRMDQSNHNYASKSSIQHGLQNKILQYNNLKDNKNCPRNSKFEADKDHFENNYQNKSVPYKRTKNSSSEPKSAFKNDSSKKHPKQICHDQDNNQKLSVKYLSSTSVCGLSDQEELSSSSSHTVQKHIPTKSLNQRTYSPKKISNILSHDSFDYGREFDRVQAREEKRIDARRMTKVKDIGFFLHVIVSEYSGNYLERWTIIFQKCLKFDNFEVFTCCDFTKSLIIRFETNEDALQARWQLYKLKCKAKDISKPHIISLSSVKKHLLRPCMCENDLIEHCDRYFDEFARKYVDAHTAKINLIIEELNSLEKCSRRSNSSNDEKSLNLQDTLNNLEAMETVFQSYVLKTKELAKQCSAPGLPELKKLKLNFSRECNSFERGLPIYSQKDVILNAIKNYPVTVIVAETGSGKSTQLTQYLLQTPFAEYGSIICTQPRKIAAVSITKFVSTQIGCSVGKEVGYDVGIEKKFEESTKIIYMTDYALLRKCLRNKNLKKVSCVIIDEAHERTLYTDLLLGLLKQCLAYRQDLRIIITSATINPSVFVEYFNLQDGAVINVPGRAYPVKVIWSERDVNEENRYVSECVKTAVKVHRKEPKGDVLVFLSSPAEIDEAILLFGEMCPEKNMPELMSLHGKSDLKDQMLVFEANTNNKRRIIFATNAAETSLTIPGIRYVIDSGMAKEMIFYPEKNKSCLMPTFINKSSAEQRKGRAGRTQPGVCYRLYSKKNYENMPERALPELLKTDLLNALLKVYEFGIKPSNFDFVESPSKGAIARSVDSLEALELIDNNELTELGKQVVQLSIEPRLAKLILLGVDSGMGHEAAIIAALVSEAGRIFLRFDDNKELADQKKKVFCKRTGDLCTFLEIYKRWLEVSQTDRFNWCISNYVSSKALNSARKTVKEILITLRQELGIKVSSRYNNLAFKENFERILLRSFVENLCIYSGHPSLGYQSPNFKESLFIHPSSSLKYLRTVPPKFLVYTVFMETSRNYILDVTPLKEETVNKAYLKGTYALSVDNLKKLQIPPVTLGPFGEKILTRYILGKGGAYINDIECKLEKLTKNRHFRIDICRDKGLVIIHVEEKYHKIVTMFIHEIVEDAKEEMENDTDVIKMDEGFSYYCLSTGGLIHDIIMPGEFREITIEPIDTGEINELKSMLGQFGKVQAFEIQKFKYRNSITVTYFTVSDAQNARKCLHEKKNKGVKVRNIVPVVKKSAKPYYKLKFKWPRLLSKGTGTILFSSTEDRTMVCGKLSSKSLYIDNNRISITPSQNDLVLNLKNIPQSANEKLLLEKISEALPGFLKELIKGVELNRMDSLPVSESEIIKIKDQLFQSLCRYTKPSMMVVDIVHPKSVSKNYEACAYFERDDDGKTAFQLLNGSLKINNIPVDILEELKSHVICKDHVYNFLQKDIHNLIKCLEGKVNATNLKSSLGDKVTIEFSSRSIKKLEEIRNKLSKLVNGRKVECWSNKKYFYFFTESGKKLLDKIQARTKTLIECDTRKKIIFLYGENSFNAEGEIHSFIKTSKLLKTKIYDLKSSNTPPGFLKELYSKYGWDLYGLVTKFDLKAANIDMKFGNLTVEGEVPRIKKVDEHLEAICAKLYATNPKKADDDNDFGFGMCAICLDPVKFDYYRLENCGHSFCKSCLLLQLESKIIPVTCAQENCGKPFFLFDINRILSLGGESLRQEFQNAALQHHVSTHAGKISYCHSPDCSTIYRVSDKRDVTYHCPSCENDICTYCQTFSHKGMDCDIFQNSKKDEDYSLKVWMKEKKSCKQCPKCKVFIEKIDGCNHMECLNCKSHLCWLCLEIFESGDLVYDHLPYCPKNQKTSTS